MMMANRVSKLAEALALLLAVSTAAVPQEHPPALEQCRADAALLETADTSILPFPDLATRAEEVEKCAKLELEHTVWFNRYSNVNDFLVTEMHKRKDDFIDRHGLRQLFLEEDAQGKR